MENLHPDERTAEARFRAVVEHLPAIVYTERYDDQTDEPGQILYVSPQVEQLLGYTAEEWMERPGWVRHLHPDDRDAVRARYERALATGEPFAATYRALTRTGEIKWFRDEAVVVHDAEGTPVYWQGVMYDVTADHAREARLRDAEARYRTLVEQLPAIVYSEDVESDQLRLVYVNPRVQELLGITPEEWMADSNLWYRMMHPDDIERVRAENERTERTGEPFMAEYRMIARDGREVWFGDEAVLVVDDDGSPRYWHGVMTDITARKEAEAQLAEAESRYRTLVEQMPTITYIDALEGPVSTLYISPQTTTILGYTPEEWYENPKLWSTIVHPDDRARTENPDPQLADAVYRMVAKDGRVVWVHDQARLILDEHGEPRYWQGVLVDITSQKRAEALERDLASERQVAHDLREADELKNTFLQAVAHDLRSPLTAILGLSSTLERAELEMNPDETRDFARRITANARRLDRLVTDMLDLERLAGGILRPVFLPLDVGTLVRELVASSELVTERRLDLDTAPLTIPADRAMVERIIDNLLTNTAKHTPGDSRIWVRVERSEGGALVTVEDDGPGVPSEDRESIFQAFRQASGTTRSSGTGVGLALVARFAALHGGRAWVEEREGGGASFRVFLSADPSGEPPAEDEHAPYRTATGSSSEASQA
jgi:PAS domain S-box-containing protein